MSKNKLSKFENEIQNHMKEERNKRSLELFDKNEWELQIAESQLLDQYIYDLEHPVWKDIIFGDINTGYKVSNTGDVIDPTGKQLRKYPLKVKTGFYYQVYIPLTGSCLVHRFVAKAFIPNPENKAHVNHIYGKKKHINWVGNLEWNTPKENSDHAWRTGLVNNNGELQGSSVYTNDQIREVCKLLQDGNLSYNEISSLTGVKHKTISDVRYGHSWKTISKDYKMPSREPRMYSDEEIENVCKLLEDPTLPQKVISYMTGVSINAIKDIMKKTSYRRISDKYNIQKRINSGIYSPISKYNENQINEVCKMLENPMILIKDIANKTGVNLSIIYDIRRGSKWKDISSKYNILKCKDSMIVE